MTATELYSDTLVTLNETRNRLLSPEWHTQLDNATKQDRIDASKQLMHVQAAVSSLSNAMLAQIADKMCANESALKESTAALKMALGHLERVADVLSTVATVLSVVAKIVPLV